MKSIGIVGVVIAIWTLVSPALARVDAVLPYAISDVWPTVIRFVRIDRGYTMKERDEEAGYVMFELHEGQRTYRGSFELVRTRDSEGRDATRVLLTLPDMPRHWEQTLLEKLTAKMKDEHGVPPPAPRRLPAERPTDKNRPRPDAGTAPAEPRPRPPGR